MKSDPRRPQRSWLKIWKATSPFRYCPVSTISWPVRSERRPDEQPRGHLVLAGPAFLGRSANASVLDLGDPSVNGVTFDESFGGAVQTIYDGTAGSGSGTPFDAAFSSEGVIACSGP